MHPSWPSNGGPAAEAGIRLGGHLGGVRLERCRIIQTQTDRSLGYQHTAGGGLRLDIDGEDTFWMARTVYSSRAIPDAWVHPANIDFGPSTPALGQACAPRLVWTSGSAQGGSLPPANHHTSAASYLADPDEGRVPLAMELIRFGCSLRASTWCTDTDRKAASARGPDSARRLRPRLRWRIVPGAAGPGLPDCTTVSSPPGLSRPRLAPIKWRRTP